MPVATPTVNGTANVSYGTATLDAHNFNEAIRLRAVHTPTFPLGDRGGALIGFGHASLLTGTIHGSSSRDTPVVPPSFFVAIAGPHAPHRRVLDGERIVATSHNESGVLPGNEP
jgi:hypothetical protein